MLVVVEDEEVKGGLVGLLLGCCKMIINLLVHSLAQLFGREQYFAFAHAATPWHAMTWSISCRYWQTPRR